MHVWLVVLNLNGLLVVLHCEHGLISLVVDVAKADVGLDQLRTELKRLVVVLNGLVVVAGLEQKVTH